MKWSQWIVSIPKQINPTSDKFSSYSMIPHNNQSVIFLCQTYEAVVSVPQRHITVPLGSKIFMPIINWISVLGGTEKKVAHLRNLAKKMIDEVATLHFFVNGKSASVNLWKFRVRSPAIDVILPIDNILDVPPGKTCIVVDGFWIFFRPLVKNLYIQTIGACRSGKTRIAVDYDVEFVSESNFRV